MNLLGVLVKRSVVLPLAIAAAVGMVGISEAAYWQSSAALAALAAELAPQDTQSLLQHREELQRTLLLSRLGVAVLSAISLFALVMVLRQALALQLHQQELQRVTQAHSTTLEATVARRTAELVELTRHLHTVREDERSRLARDLHDELGALLTSAKLDAARVRTRLQRMAGEHTAGAAEALERLVHQMATLDRVISLKRRITEDLRPSALAHLGLVPTLEILAQDFTQGTGTVVNHALEPVVLTPDAQIMVYRLVQEGLNNVSKHAHAKQVWLSLRHQAGHVRLQLRDDGVGFDPSRPGTQTHGLLGMRTRVQAEHGTLALHTAPGRGVHIDVQLPAAKLS